MLRIIRQLTILVEVILTQIAAVPVDQLAEVIPGRADLLVVILDQGEVVQLVEAQAADQAVEAQAADQVVEAQAADQAVEAQAADQAVEAQANQIQPAIQIQEIVKLLRRLAEMVELQIPYQMQRSLVEPVMVDLADLVVKAKVEDPELESDR